MTQLLYRISWTDVLGTVRQLIYVSFFFGFSVMYCKSFSVFYLNIIERSHRKKKIIEYRFVCFWTAIYAHLRRRNNTLEWRLNDTWYVFDLSIETNLGVMVICLFFTLRWWIKKETGFTCAKVEVKQKDVFTQTWSSN